MRVLSKILPSVLLCAIGVWAQSNPATSTGVSFSATPIMDMGTSSSYKGFQGGLYENDSNVVPTDHDAAGRKFAAQITPINGKIVLLSIGMSNVMDEFGMFINNYAGNPQINQNVKLVNGAFQGVGACAWTVPFGSPHGTCGGNAPNPYDYALTHRITPAGLTESQVQAVWLKEADSMSAQVPWPPSLPSSSADAYKYEGFLGGILRAAKQRYPNLKLVFISSRIYGGYNQQSKSHEPYAYEYGFSTKWAIQAQINQADRRGSQDAIAGNLSYSVAPWAAWGPYLWADGNIPRSDGLAWCNGQSGLPCYGEVDFQSDGLHPNVNGQTKVATMLMNFFLTSSYTTWFKAQSTTSPGNVTITMSPTDATVGSGGMQQFTAGIRGTSNTAVNWSASAGKVSSTGLFTAPTVTASSTMTVTATSVADATQQAAATVTVSPAIVPSPTPPPTPPPPSPLPPAAPSPANTLAGGLTALPLADALGNNVVANPGLTAGAAIWSLPSCFSVDPAHSYQGSQSLRFIAGTGCSSAVASTTVTRGPNAARSYTLQGWVMTSSGSNIQVKLTIHDQNDGGDIVGGVSLTAPGPTWTFIQRKNIDLLPIHDGHTLVVDAVAQGTTGMAWVNSPQLIEQKPLPVSAFLLYPNYKGYLWGNGPQTIRLQVEVPNPTGMTVFAVLQVEGGTTIATLQQSAQSKQELDFDGSGLATGSYLLQTVLLDGNGHTVATYPSYRIKKVDPSFQNALVNYIDTDNFLVRKGQKHFVWGVYDRWSTHRCGAAGAIPCVSTNESSYLQIPGFNGLSTVGSYADTLLNAEMSILPFAGVNPSPSSDQLTPWLAAVDGVGMGHLQIVNNWVTGNRARPIWAQGISDLQMWQTLTNTQSGKAGGLGYYTYDEPTPDMIPTVFGQWPTLSSRDPGGILFGTLANVGQLSRWRDMADVMSADPYPVGNPPNADDYAYGERMKPPMMKTSVVTREVVRQSYGSRAVWMVPQLFDLNGQFPTYTQMKMQAYKAIINGATGLLWWGFVSQQGIEYEWYVAGNQQPYFDFKRLSHEVMGLEPILISPPQPQLMASVSDPRIEYLVKEDSTRIVIFASNFSDATLANVTFKLSSSAGVSSVPVQVYSEGRNLGLNGLSFTDSFAPSDVHVYVVSR